ncbi:hypothetical protein Lal_00026723 [Lupinus albus]|nr:hypothetical protein Lal_00026723 [Lupinus albus]
MSCLLYQLITCKLLGSPKLFAQGLILVSVTSSRVLRVAVTWNAIHKARDQLQGGYKFIVGVGNTSLWFDHWLKGGPISNMIAHIDIQHQDLLIKDVFVNNSWHLDSITTIIPPEVKDMLERHQLFIHPMGHDHHV